MRASTPGVYPEFTRSLPGVYPGAICVGDEQIVGIDAEFVALTAEETELRMDGTNVVTKTSRMSLGRVSVVRDLDRS